MLALAPDALEAAAPEALAPVEVLVLRLEAAEAFDSCDNSTAKLGIGMPWPGRGRSRPDQHAQRRTSMLDIELYVLRPSAGTTSKGC